MCSMSRDRPLSPASVHAEAEVGGAMQGIDEEEESYSPQNDKGAGATAAFAFRNAK